MGKGTAGSEWRLVSETSTLPGRVGAGRDCRALRSCLAPGPQCPYIGLQYWRCRARETRDQEPRTRLKGRGRRQGRGGPLCAVASGKTAPGSGPEGAVSPPRLFTPSARGVFARQPVGDGAARGTRRSRGRPPAPDVDTLVGGSPCGGTDQNGEAGPRKDASQARHDGRVRGVPSPEGCSRHGGGRSSLTDTLTGPVRAMPDCRALRSCVAPGSQRLQNWRCRASATRDQEPGTRDPPTRDPPTRDQAWGTHAWGGLYLEQGSSR